MISKLPNFSVIAKYGLISYSLIFVLFNISYILRDLSSIKSDFQLKTNKSDSNSAKDGDVRGIQTTEQKYVMPNCQVVFPIKAQSNNFNLFVCEDAVFASGNRGLPEESLIIDNRLSFPELFNSPVKILVEGLSENGVVVKIQTANCFLERCVPNIGLYEISENQRGVLETKVIYRLKATDYLKSQKLEFRVTSISPLSFSINFDLGYISTLNNTFKWVNFFEVDGTTRTPKLVNSKHKDEFIKLLEEYQTLEKDPCVDFKEYLNFYSEKMTISALLTNADRDADDELCPFKNNYIGSNPLSPKENEAWSFLDAKNKILGILNNSEYKNSN